MLFHVTWEFIDTSEDGIRRSLEVFSKWEPPGWRVGTGVRAEGIPAPLGDTDARLTGG